MRLTGGEHRGRRIQVPLSRVRPTQDQVREALFSMLAAQVPGCRFLDLYAGSGAVGLEALSRGASSVVWVERDPATFRLLEQNVSLLTKASAEQPVPEALCVRRDVRAFLRCAPIAPFDIVFADPPYSEVSAYRGGVALGVRLLDQLATGNWLVSNSLAVIETACADAGFSCHGWDLIQMRSYGKTAVSIYRIRES